jgi:hypothetical protein
MKQREAFLVYFIVMVLSFPPSRAQQKHAWSFLAGPGVGYNYLQAEGSYFGYHLYITPFAEFEWRNLLKGGLMMNVSTGDINRKITRNDGGVFDSDRGFSLVCFSPYAGVIIPASPRLNIAPQIGYRLDLYNSDRPSLPDPVQSFNAGGLNYMLAIDYLTRKPESMSRMKGIRLLLNYSTLTIKGTPEKLNVFGAGIYLTVTPYGNKRAN